jgi:hypothetical protein
MLEEAVTEVNFTITPADGSVGAPLDEYVKQVGKNTTGPGTITMDVTFSMSHPQFEEGDDQTFSSEGQPQ